MPKQFSTLTSVGVAVARAIDACGLDRQTLFRRAGLDIEAMKNPNARYADATLGKLVRLAADAADEPGFGFQIARFITPTTLHALGYSLLASETLLAACQRLVRYYRIVSDGIVMSLAKSKKGYTLSITFLDPPEPEQVDALMAVLVGLFRHLSDNPAVPSQIHLRRQQPAVVEPYSEYFQDTLVFGAEQDSLLFDKATLEAELPTGNAELAYQNDKIIADYLARFDANRLSERVRSIFLERLVTGKFSEEQIAEQLNLSLRSLQRRLHEEQTSYQQLLDETRLELALQYINRTPLSVAQITPLLGFSDSSNFNRAFKRWLGISPSKYRALGFS